MKFNLGVAMMALLSLGTINAQEDIDNGEFLKQENFKGLYLGGLAGTNGYGGELKYIFNKRFTIKASYETLNLSVDFDLGQGNMDYATTLDYTSGGISVLVDYNFTRNLYLSAGVLFNDFNPTVAGSPKDMQYGDITIPGDLLGAFEFAVKPDMQVSPYAGIGVRSFFGKKKRVVFHTEVGAFYLGAPQIEIKATGILAPTANPVHEQQGNLEKQVEQYTFLPAVKLGLAVKLF